MYFCPYCTEMVGDIDNGGCCGESSGHMINKEIATEHGDNYMLEVISEYEQSKQLEGVYKI